MFCKKGVLRNFVKFTWKHMCQNLFFNKVAGLSPATLLKKKLWHRCFPVNFVKFLRTSFFTLHFQTTASVQVSIFHVRTFWVFYQKYSNIFLYVFSLFSLSLCVYEWNRFTPVFAYNVANLNTYLSFSMCLKAYTKNQTVMVVAEGQPN